MVALFSMCLQLRCPQQINFPSQLLYRCAILNVDFFLKGRWTFILLNLFGHVPFYALLNMCRTVGTCTYLLMDSSYVLYLFMNPPFVFLPIRLKGLIVTFLKQYSRVTLRFITAEKGPEQCPELHQNLLVDICSLSHWPTVSRFHLPESLQFPFLRLWVRKEQGCQNQNVTLFKDMQPSSRWVDYAIFGSTGVTYCS